MERIGVIVVSAIIVIIALVYIAKLVILKLTGFKTDAEVISIQEPKQGYFVHKLRFCFNEKMIEKDDKTGYSQPFSRGDIKKIVCSKKNSDKFEYIDALNKNIIVASVLLFMAILIIIRFAFFVDEL